MTDALKSFGKLCKRVLLNTINMPLKSEIYFAYSVLNMDRARKYAPFSCLSPQSSNLVHFSIFIYVSIAHRVMCVWKILFNHDPNEKCLSQLHISYSQRAAQLSAPLLDVCSIFLCVCFFLSVLCSYFRFVSCLFSLSTRCLSLYFIFIHLAY